MEPNSNKAGNIKIDPSGQLPITRTRPEDGSLARVDDEKVGLDSSCAISEQQQGFIVYVPNFFIF